MIVANDVSTETGIGGAQGVMGGDRNRVRIVARNGVDEWPELSKERSGRADRATCALTG